MNIKSIAKTFLTALALAQLSGCLVDDAPPSGTATFSAASLPAPAEPVPAEPEPAPPAPFPFITPPPSPPPVTPPPPSTPPANVNQAPTISGPAPSTVTAGIEYSFTPVASDPDGDALLFQIRNQPGWSRFSTATGELSGMPAESDIGFFNDVEIEVSDGELTAVLTSISIEVLAANQPPVSNAEYVGFGSATRGHESCPTPYDVYQVTSLSGGSGTGTLRDAVSQGCRHIIFSVGGTIDLGDLQISESYLTIDGKTAPAPGITLTNVGRLVLEARNSTPVHDVIVNNIRAIGRGGDIETNDLWELDGSSGADIYNIVLDHLTMRAASDGAVDIYGNVHDVTLSNSIIMDTIKAQHYSQSSALRERITVYQNVYARNNERQPRIRYNTRQVDFVGNVIYGWGWMSNGAAGMNPEVGGQQFSPSVNVENNVYHHVAGLNGGPDDALLIEGGFDGQWHFANNVWPTGENQGDSVSTSPRVSLVNQGTNYAVLRATSDIISAGSHFPTSEESTLLGEIDAAVSGSTPPPNDPPPSDPPPSDPPPSDPPPNDPPPSDPPPNDPPPPPPPGEPGAYRGIPDPTATIGYDPYAGYSIDQNGSGCEFSGSGTASNPYVVDLGGSTTNCGSTGVRLSGSYVILQNGTFNLTSDKALEAESCTNCTVRDANFFGTQSGSEFGSLINLGSRSVVLRTEVAYFGQNTGAGPENDLHGMKACGSDKWILDAHWHHLGGDSVQVGDASRCSGNNIFIGGGSFHHNRENCIDIKDSSNVVASGFECYLPNNKPDEAGVILHDNPIDPQILDGNIYNVNVGIEISGQVNVVVNGNQVQANDTGIIVRSANVNISGNSITAPTCVVDQGGVSGNVQSGCN